MDLWKRILAEFGIPADERGIPIIKLGELGFPAPRKKAKAINAFTFELKRRNFEIYDSMLAWFRNFELGLSAYAEDTMAWWGQVKMDDPAWVESFDKRLETKRQVGLRGFGNTHLPHFPADKCAGCGTHKELCYWPPDLIKVKRGEGPFEFKRGNIHQRR